MKHYEEYWVRKGLQALNLALNVSLLSFHIRKPTLFCCRPNFPFGTLYILNFGISYWKATRYVIFSIIFSTPHFVMIQCVKGSHAKYNETESLVNNVWRWKCLGMFIVTFEIGTHEMWNPRGSIVDMTWIAYFIYVIVRLGELYQKLYGVSSF
jgi:hypothetical protein